MLCEKSPQPVLSSGGIVLLTLSLWSISSGSFLIEGGTMSKTLLSPLAALVFLCSVVSAWSQSELPEGSGKRAGQTYCVQCHDLSTVTPAGYSEQNWRNNLDMMINVGATLPREQLAEVTQYLAIYYPYGPRRAPQFFPARRTTAGR